LADDVDRNLSSQHPRQAQLNLLNLFLRIFQDFKIGHFCIFQCTVAKWQGLFSSIHGVEYLMHRWGFCLNSRLKSFTNNK